MDKQVEFRKTGPEIQIWVIGWYSNSLTLDLNATRLDEISKGMSVDGKVPRTEPWMLQL